MRSMGLDETAVVERRSVGRTIGLLPYLGSDDGQGDTKATEESSYIYVQTRQGMDHDQG